MTLDRQEIKLFTFLVGQQEPLAQKTALQVAGKTQIVACLMVEDLAFYGMQRARCSDLSQWRRSDLVSGEKSLEFHAILRASGV
jgi:hypothetical protein